MAYRIIALQFIDKPVLLSDLNSPQLGENRYLVYYTFLILDKQGVKRPDTACEAVSLSTNQQATADTT